MFSKLKKKKTIFSPMTGQLIPLATVKDPVFSQGMMGPGFAIEPTSGEIYSPVEGTVTNIFPTKHALSLKSKNGKEILLHIGIDTVALQGEGFDILTKENAKVTKETLLARVDRDYLKQHGKHDTLMVLFPEEQSLPIHVEVKETVAQTALFDFE